MSSQSKTIFSVSAVYILGAVILLLLPSSKPKKKHTPKFSRQKTTLNGIGNILETYLAMRLRRQIKTKRHANFVFEHLS